MTWKEAHVGDRPILAATVDRAGMFFSCGPALGVPDYEEVAETLLSTLVPSPVALRWCRQVHGRVLGSLSSEPGRQLSGVACVGRCDGLLTDEPGIGLMVWTADCVPVLLAADCVVGAAHAGWRGAAAGIVPTAVRRFQLEYGVPPEELTVALGPAVGPCHYEVGEEVVEALARAMPSAENGTWHRGRTVDLRQLLRLQLVNAGVSSGRIEIVGGCTACTADCASYRRDGDRAGRQWSLVMLTGSSMNNSDHTYALR